MRLIINIIMCSLSVYFCEGQNHNTLKSKKLKGAIKIITEKKYDARKVGRKIIRGDIKKFSIELYNKEGKLTTRRLYYKDATLKNVVKCNNTGKKVSGINYDFTGSIKSSWKKKYSKDGKYIDGIEYDSNKNIIAEIKSKYNTKGNLIETLELGLSRKGKLEEIFKSLYKYDTKNNLLSRINYNKKKLSGSYFYKYDSKNNVIEFLKLNSKGGTEEKIITEYDVYRNEVNKKEWQKKTNLFHKRKNIYDVNHNCIESIDIKERNHISKTVSKFDNKNNKLEEIIYLNGKFTSKWNYKYDEFNKKIEKIHYNKEGFLKTKDVIRYNSNNIEPIDWKHTSYEKKGENLNSFTSGGKYFYQNDSKGNWVLKIKYRMSSSNTYNAEYVKERQIQYY